MASLFVSLTIQLVSSVREIRRFLYIASEAPKELRRLIDLLEQLELILEQVGMLVERQRGDARFGETGMSTIVLRAINTCERNLAMLESLVESTKFTTAIANRAARTIEFFKLACKRRIFRD